MFIWRKTSSRCLHPYLEPPGFGDIFHTLEWLVLLSVKVKPWNFETWDCHLADGEVDIDWRVALWDRYVWSLSNLLYIIFSICYVWQRSKGTMPFRIRAMICLQVNRIFSWYIFDKKDRREKTDLLTTPGTGDPDWRFTVPWMFGGFWGSTLPMSQVRSLLTGSNVYLPWKLEKRTDVIILKMQIS